MYGSHATDIVGYAYQADTYCPGCIADMLRNGPVVDAETAIAALAKTKGLDPTVTQDTNDLPFPIFASDDACDEDGRAYCCGRCHAPLIDS